MYDKETSSVLIIYRQQKGQRYDCVHALEQLEERWQHGGRTGGVQGSAKGTLYMCIAFMSC
jgi:hypothetical protein